jgi:hypothetical protein
MIEALDRHAVLKLLLPVIMDVFYYTFLPLRRAEL